MKKLKRCPVCGSKGEDIAFAFLCSNLKCKNYRKDIELVIPDDNDDNEDIFCWPIYDDE